MRRQGRVILLFSLAIVLIASAGFAGTILINEEGIIAKALCITFSEDVEISSFGGAFNMQDPACKASEFRFTGGMAKPTDTFWLLWNPASATITGYKWLPNIPIAGEDLESHNVIEKSDEPNVVHNTENTLRIVDQIITERGIAKYALRKHSIDYDDLPILRVLFRTSASDSQLSKHFPISTWEELYSYLSFSEDSPRLETKALILRFLFDLSGEWPWKYMEPQKPISMPNASISYKTVDLIIEERGFDAHCIRKRCINLEDISLLSLFFSSAAIDQLAQAFPITRWQTLNDMGQAICSKSQALLLRFLFNLKGRWPWAPPSGLKTSIPSPRANHTATGPTELEVHWEFEWRSSSTKGCTVSVEVTIQNKGFRTSKNTVCWVGLHDIGSWYYDTDESLPLDIEPGEKWRFPFYLHCDYGVWTRFDITVSNDLGRYFIDKSREFFTG